MSGSFDHNFDHNAGGFIWSIAGANGLFAYQGSVPLFSEKGKAALLFYQTSGGQQLSRGMSLCGTMIFVARRFGFSMWLMVWLAASMPSW